MSESETESDNSSDETFQEKMIKDYSEDTAYAPPGGVMEPDIEYDTDASITETEDSEPDEESQDDSLSIEVIKSKITQILNKTGQGGTIGVGELYPSLPSLAGISITGYGPVAVPVTAQTVENLRQHFEQAPYGMGEDTLLDLDVRNSWQMGPNKFKINNMEFNQKIEELVLDVKKRLGCEDVSVESKLYKLLLYEPGGHFKPHRDTEKDDGMFATLIIQLPSVFTGGDLVITHNEQQEIVQFSQEGSCYSCVFAAHYADCQHELTQVTSGYRLALIYSLCHRGRGLVPSANQLSNSSRLTKFLKLYRGVSSSSPYLVWQFSHLYSKNSLEKFGSEAMKGVDRQILDAIMLANKDLDDNDKIELAFLRASKEDEEYGDCTEREYGGYRGSWPSSKYYGGDEESDDAETQSSNCFEFCDVSDYHLNIDSIFPIGANTVVPELDLNEILANVLNNKLTATDFWGKGKPDECSGPSGNEGATRSMWYHRCFLVMWKKSESAKIRYATDFRGAVQHIVSLNKNENRDEAKKELDSFLPYCRENNKLIIGSQEDDSCVIQVLRVVSSFALPGYLFKVLRLISGSTNLGSYLTVGLLKDLQTYVEKFSWKVLQPEIENIFKNVPDDETTITISTGLSNIISCCSKDNKPTDLKVSLFKEMEKRCLNTNLFKIRKHLINIWKAVQDYGGGDCNTLLQKMVDVLIWPYQKNLTLKFKKMDLETLIEKMADAFPDHNHVKNDAFFKGVVDTFLEIAGSNYGETFEMKTLVYLSLSCQDEVSSGMLLTDFKRRIDCGDIGEMDCPTILRLEKVVLKYMTVFNHSKADGMEEEMLQKVIGQIRSPMTIIKLMDQLQNQDKEKFLKQLAKQFLVLAKTTRINSSYVLLYVKILVKANFDELMKELSVQLQNSPYVVHLDQYLSNILEAAEIQPFPSPLFPLIHKRLSQLEPQVAEGKPPFTWNMPEVFTDRQELTAFLHGAEETYTLMGFKTIIQANNWVKCEARQYKKHFTTGEASGKGKNCQVFIQKIRNEKTTAVQKYNDVMREIKKLKSHLPKVNRKMPKPPKNVELVMSNSKSEQLTKVNLTEDIKVGTNVPSEQQIVREKINVWKTCPNQHMLKLVQLKTRKIDSVWRCTYCNKYETKPETLRYRCSQKVCPYNFCIICYSQIPGKTQHQQQILGKTKPVQQISGKEQPVQQVPGKIQPIQQIPGKMQPVQQISGNAQHIQQISGKTQPIQQIPGKTQSALPIPGKSQPSPLFKFKKVIPCTVTSGSNKLDMGQHKEATEQISLKPLVPNFILKKPLTSGAMTSENKIEKDLHTKKLNVKGPELDTEINPWGEMDDDFLLNSVDSILTTEQQEEQKQASNKSHQKQPETNLSKICLNNHTLKLVSSKTRKNDYLWSCTLCKFEENSPETLRYRCSHHKECNFNLCSRCYKTRAYSSVTVQAAPPKKIKKAPCTVTSEFNPSPKKKQKIDKDLWDDEDDDFLLAVSSFDKDSTAAISDPVKKNSSGRDSRIGETGKYYCNGNMGSPSCYCCDGYCGPDNGCNCEPCMKLDVTTRKLARNDYVNNAGEICGKNSETGLFMCGRPVNLYLNCGTRPNNQQCASCKIMQIQVDRMYSGVW